MGQGTIKTNPLDHGQVIYFKILILKWVFTARNAAVLSSAHGSRSTKNK